MRFGLYACNVGEFSDVRILSGIAAEADAAGFDGFFISDWTLPSAWPNEQPAGVADVQVGLTAVALSTSRLRFGAMVSPLPRRRPVKFAREIASLDRLSGGRVIVGAGSGHEVVTEFERLGEPPDARVRADRLDESLAIVDQLLRGAEVTFAGEHYSVDRTRFFDAPSGIARAPIWLGALPDRPRTLRRAARWDGVFALRSDFGVMSVDDVALMRNYVLAHGTRPTRSTSWSRHSSRTTHPTRTRQRWRHIPMSAPRGGSSTRGHRPRHENSFVAAGPRSTSVRACRGSHDCERRSHQQSATSVAPPRQLTLRNGPPA